MDRAVHDEESHPPDCISLETHRDEDHAFERWARWLVVGALLAFAAGGLVGVFGQRPEEASAAAAGATIRVSAPGALRSGVLFQGRVEVEARAPLSRPTLAWERGWFESITVNTVVPTPAEERTDDGGGVAMEFAPLAAGRSMTVYVQFQVNPTAVGRRVQGIELRDGDHAVARIERTVTIFP